MTNSPGADDAREGKTVFPSLENWRDVTLISQLGETPDEPQLSAKGVGKTKHQRDQRRFRTTHCIHALQRSALYLRQCVLLIVHRYHQQGKGCPSNNSLSAAYVSNYLRRGAIVLSCLHLRDLAPLPLLQALNVRVTCESLEQLTFWTTGMKLSHMVNISSDKGQPL